MNNNLDLDDIDINIEPKKSIFVKSDFKGLDKKSKFKGFQLFMSETFYSEILFMGFMYIIIIYFIICLLFFKDYINLDNILFQVYIVYMGIYFLIFGNSFVGFLLEGIRERIQKKYK